MPDPVMATRPHGNLRGKDSCSPDVPIRYVKDTLNGAL